MLKCSWKKSPPLIFTLPPHIWPVSYKLSCWSQWTSPLEDVGRKHTSLHHKPSTGHLTLSPWHRTAGCFLGFYHRWSNNEPIAHTLLLNHSLRGEIFLITFKNLVPVVPKVGVSIFLRDPNTTKVHPQQCKAVDPALNTKLQAAADERQDLFHRSSGMGFSTQLPLLSFPVSDA